MKIKNSIRLLLAIVIPATTIAGCKSVGPEYGIFGDGRVNVSGANQLFTGEFEEIDLIKLLDPMDIAKNNTEENGKKWEDLPDEEKLEAAYNAFYEYDTTTLKRRRNQVQERILSASNQRCNLYKTYLKNLHARSNFLLGATTTLLGGAGAIVTGASMARLLAGAAGITSGVRAEFDQAYFSTLAVNVIVVGIEKKREEEYEKMLERRKNDAIEDYPVEAAVKDAIKYHGDCNILSGLEKADSALQMDYKKGLGAFKDVAETADAIRQNLNAKPLANAGVDQTQSVGCDVTLNGRGSDVDKDKLNYKWSFKSQPNGSSTKIENETAPVAKFMADMAGEYEVALVVNDGRKDSDPSLVKIKVAENTTPEAVIKEVSPVTVNAEITLDGSGSKDQDLCQPKKYKWTIKSPEGADVPNSPTDDKTTFTAKECGTYTAILVVDDGYKESNPAQTSITVKPIANAGNNINDAKVGTEVTLDGNLSEPKGGGLTYKWDIEPSASKRTTGSEIKFSFTPESKVNKYVVKLTVTCGNVGSDPYEVTINVTE